jgi:large subunit ribosomal protein L19
MNLAHNYIKSLQKRELPEVNVGDVVRIHQKIQEGEKTRIQIFEGLVIAHKHGKEPGATITVRKVSNGIGIERIFPLAMPSIEKVEIIRQAKTRRSKLYYLRDKTARETRKKLRLQNVPPGEMEWIAEEPQKNEQESKEQLEEESQEQPEKEISEGENKEELKKDKEADQKEENQETKEGEKMEEK